MQRLQQLMSLPVEHLQSPQSQSPRSQSPRSQSPQSQSPQSQSPQSQSPRSQSPVIDKNAQCRLILELAWKTMALMQKNSMIQQRIVALQKETSEFVATVMSNPENKRRYAEHLRVYGQHPQSLLLYPAEQNSTEI